MDIKILPISEKGIEPLHELLLQYHSKEEVVYLTDIIKGTISRDAKDKSEAYVVAKDNKGNLLGLLGYRNLIQKFKLYSIKSKPLEIYSLFVNQSHAREGVGSSLVNYIKNFAVKNSFDEIIVRSAYKFKETGWQFYEKLGFELVGKMEESSGIQSNIYRLIL